MSFAPGKIPKVIEIRNVAYIAATSSHPPTEEVVSCVAVLHRALSVYRNHTLIPEINDGVPFPYISIVLL